MITTSRGIIRQLEEIQGLMGTYDGPAMECIALILKWRNSPDVILAATERILEVTRERMEAQR